MIRIGAFRRSRSITTRDESLSNRAPKSMKSPVRKQPGCPEKLELFPAICGPRLSLPNPADRNVGRAAPGNTHLPRSAAREAQRATPLRYNTAAKPARPTDGSGPFVTRNPSEWRRRQAASRTRLLPRGSKRRKTQTRLWDRRGDVRKNRRQSGTKAVCRKT